MGSFTVAYHPLVVKRDIPRLDKSMALRVRSAIEAKLMTRPEIYGIPLRATLKKFWKLRLGDWRVVYEIRNKTVSVLAIAHRREVYDMVNERL